MCLTLFGCNRVFSASPPVPPSLSSPNPSAFYFTSKPGFLLIFPLCINWWGGGHRSLKCSLKWGGRGAGGFPLLALFTYALLSFSLLIFLPLRFHVYFLLSGRCRAQVAEVGNHTKQPSRWLAGFPAFGSHLTADTSSEAMGCLCKKMRPAKLVAPTVPVALRRPIRCGLWDSRKVEKSRGHLSTLSTCPAHFSPISIGLAQPLPDRPPR